MPARYCYMPARGLLQDDADAEARSLMARAEALIRYERVYVYRLALVRDCYIMRAARAGYACAKESCHALFVTVRCYIARGGCCCY